MADRVQVLRRRFKQTLGTDLRYQTGLKRTRTTGWTDFDSILPDDGLPLGRAVGWSGPGICLTLDRILPTVGPAIMADASAPEGRPNEGLQYDHAMLARLAGGSVRDLHRALRIGLDSGCFGLGIWNGEGLDESGVRQLQHVAARASCLLFVIGPYGPETRPRLRGRLIDTALTIEGPQGRLTFSLPTPYHEVPLCVDPSLPDRRGPGD